MKKMFMKGNEAIAEAAVRAGCRFFAGYPITPQNEIPEYMARRLPEVGGSFVQGESEVASINMVFGAAATGTKAMTSSSSPGISLKSEGISYLAGAELPAVIINVMRGGPGLGSIQSAQMDYLQATKASGHGGFRMIVYAPATVQETVDMVYMAFEKAAEYQTPVMVVPDGCIGSMMEPVVLPDMKENIKNELKFMASECINPRRKVVSSILLIEAQQESFNRKLEAMYKKWNDEEILVEEYMVEDAEYIIAAYGTSARIAKTAIKALREKGIKAGLIRPKTLYPFPYKSFKKLSNEKVKNILVVEMSIPAQMVEDVSAAVGDRIPVSTFGHSGGILIYDEEVIEQIEKLAKEGC